MSPLPGMESADRDRELARAEAEALALTEELLSPAGDVSRMAGEMERSSPLFFGTGANPGLF